MYFLFYNMNFNRDQFNFMRGKLTYVFEFYNLFVTIKFLDKLKVQCKLSDIME